MAALVDDVDEVVGRLRKLAQSFENRPRSTSKNV
jgi:hypothetical protein